jgi:phosphatidylglycerol:prolipoprotein diacylglycerol transferase
MLSAALAVWVHNLSPFIIRFSENSGIRYYGTSYVLGFLAALWLLTRYSKSGRSPLSVERVWDLILALMIGVYVGGRLGYFLLYSDLAQIREDPLSLFRVWQGGMAFHGGLIGVAIALWVYSRISKIEFPRICDLVATVTPIGLLLGRIANFINGELWGKTTNVSWAVIFPQSELPGTPLALIAPRHPSQLYEAALEGALLFAIVQWRFWRSGDAGRPGRISGHFLVCYAMFRSFCELFREPDYGVSPLLGLSRGTFYSIFLLLAGAIFYWYSAREHGAPRAVDGKK